MKSTAHNYHVSSPDILEGHWAGLIPDRWMWRLYKIALFVSDLLMINLAFWLAYYVRFETRLPFFQYDFTPSYFFYLRLTGVLSVVLLILFVSGGLYQRRNLLGGTQEYEKVFRSVTAGFFLIIILGFLDPGFIVARGWLLLSWSFSFILVDLGRFLLRRVVYNLRENGFFLSRAIIVGANEEGLELAKQFMNRRSSGLEVIGLVDKKLPPGTILGEKLRVLGSSEELHEVVADYRVEEIILASSAISSHDQLVPVFQRYGTSEDVTVRLSSGLYEIITTGLTVREFASVPLVGVNRVRLTGTDEFLKLVLDYALTIPGLILISPLLLAIAIAIKLDSPGPVFHRRKVVGVNGETFHAYKFRTMYTNGDEILARSPELQEELARNHKLKNDPRVTPLGHFLRKYSLDELPQLFNVLLRQMSLVGPRMISPEEVENYQKWNINLLTVRPGITGLWQVSGRSDVSYEERVRLDMHYIRNWSIWLDLHLLIQTIPAVIHGRGAY